MATFNVEERNNLPQDSTEQLLDTSSQPDVLWTANNSGAVYQPYNPPSGTEPAYFLD